MRRSARFVLCVSVFVAICSTSRLLAQSVSLPTEGAYHPGQFVPLRIDASAPGIVRVRAPDALGIDWTAPGRASVVVPWVIWRTTPGEIQITINDRVQTLQLSPRPREEAIQSVDASAQSLLDRTGPLDRFGGVSAHAYAPVYDYAPGRPEGQRTRIVTWSIVAVLGLAAMALSPRKYRAIAMLAGAFLLCGAIAWNIQPALAPRAVIVRAPGFTDTWIYHPGAVGQRVHEPLNGDAWVVPSSLGEISAIDPVLQVDSTGAPVELRGAIPPSGFLAFVKRGADAEAVDAERWASPMFAVRFYGQAGTIGADQAIELKP